MIDLSQHNSMNRNYHPIGPTYAMDLLPKEGIDPAAVPLMHHQRFPPIGQHHDPDDDNIKSPAEVVVSSSSNSNSQPRPFSPKKFNLPKVLPDLPSMTLLRERRKSVSPPQDPIIQMIPVSEYEKLYPPLNQRPELQTQLSLKSAPRNEVESQYSNSTGMNGGSTTGSGNPFVIERSKTLPHISDSSNNYDPFPRGPLGQAFQNRSNKSLEELKFTAPAENSPPVISTLGEKSPPGTLKRRGPEGGGQSSCRNWCSQYSQSFLARTIETTPPPPPILDDVIAGNGGELAEVVEEVQKEKSGGCVSENKTDSNLDEDKKKKTNNNAQIDEQCNGNNGQHATYSPVTEEEEKH